MMNGIIQLKLNYYWPEEPGLGGISVSKVKYSILISTRPGPLRATACPQVQALQYWSVKV